MSTLTTTISLRLPAPAVYRPRNSPKARFESLGTDDCTGRLCGTVTVGKSEVAFSMGGDDDDDVQYMLDEMNGYETNLDLSEILPDNVNEWEYRQYLLGIMKSIEQPILNARNELLEQFGQALAEAAA